MTQSITVEVDTAREAADLEAGLARPDVRAFVRMMGALREISHDRARARVLAWLTDYAADPTNTRMDRFAPIGTRE